jgi:hypothetical protein
MGKSKSYILIVKGSCFGWNTHKMIMSKPRVPDGGTDDRRMTILCTVYKKREQVCHLFFHVVAYVLTRSQEAAYEVISN